MPADLPVGLLAAGAATWVSLHLLPATHLRLRLWPLAAYVLHFLGQSVRSGVQVARLALQPSMPIRPGFVTWRGRLASDSARSTFCALASLLPGTLPTGSDEQNALLIHCLDLGQPVAAELAREEALFSRMIGDE